MKTKITVLTLAVFLGAAPGWAKEASISQMIASLNADAQKPGGDERVLKSISASTHTPAATLAKEKSSSGLSYGELYIAHAIASASGKNFNEVAQLKKKGKTWDQIADENNVSLGGKKVKKMAATNPSPTPRTMPKAPSNATDQSSSYKAPSMH